MAIGHTFSQKLKAVSVGKSDDYWDWELRMSNTSNPNGAKTMAYSSKTSKEVETVVILRRQEVEENANPPPIYQPKRYNL